MRSWRSVVPFLPLALLSSVGCKADPMKNMENARDALIEKRDLSFEGVPTCGPTGVGCVEKLSRYYGSKDGFNGMKPDQASSAAMSVLLLRDHRGDFALLNATTPSKLDAWLTVLRAGKGVGVDMLRLAVFRRAEEASARLARSWDDPATLHSFFADIASVVPAACRTYGLLAQGEKQLAAVDDEDHSACVQADLSRRDGPGPLYGEGPFRAAAGALAAYRDTLHALRAGLSLMSARVRTPIDAKLLELENASDKIALRKVVRSGADAAAHLANVHALAGAPMSPAVVVDGGAPDAK